MSARARVAGLLVAAALFGASIQLYAQSEKPPELVQLEKEVALKIAHARGIGYPDHGRRAKLAEAERDNLHAQQAIFAGKYNDAVQKLLHAKVVLRDLGM
ncbi:MAG: hypothetical protein ACREQB_13415 [Candidatus Binataceae bacterium]